MSSMRLILSELILSMGIYFASQRWLPTDKILSRKLLISVPAKMLGPWTAAKWAGKFKFLI
jgi:hypothetical protein